MPADPNTLVLFAALGALLVLATVFGLSLARSRETPDPIIEHLNQRIGGWWLMAALIAIAVIFGRPGVIVLFALVSFTTLREFVTLTETRRGDHYALVVVFFIILPAQYMLVAIERYDLMALFIPVYAFLFLPIVAALRPDTTRFMEPVAVTQWALMLSVYCLSHVPTLITLDIPGYAGRDLLLIAFLVLVAQSGDVLQYAFGRRFGRTRIAESLPPTKTWESFLGGAGTASLVGAALFWITPFSPIEAWLMSLAITLAGAFGGLVMSALKRDRGVKDWGHTVEGQGGILDRLESVVFAAPLFFHLTRYFWAA